MTVTMALIARRLNLSQATVSRVLNGKGEGFISDTTRKLVLDTATELDYFAGRAQRSAAHRRMGVVALWIRNPDAPFYARIVRQVQALTAAEGSELVLSGHADRGGEPDFDKTAPRAVSPAAWPVDGIIAMDCPRRVAAYLARAGARAVPVVGAGSEVVAETDSVSFDPVSGVEAAVRHLIETGRQRIAHLTADCTIRSIQRVRCETYERVVREAGMEPAILRTGDESRSASRTAVCEALRGGARFDGLFCLNDDMAIGAYRGILDAERRVPDDIGLIGYDSIEDTEYLEVPISSVLQDHEELCRRAWELLWRRIGDRTAERVQEVLRPELIVRTSTNLKA